MPDWLHKHAPYAGTVDEGMEDDDMAAEQRWLAARVRLLSPAESSPELRHLCKPDPSYRNAATWFLIALDSY